MPPGKRQQTNPMLYTLIAFVGLFIIATTVAVIFYVKSEEHRKEAFHINATATEVLAESVERIGGRFVYVSSDMVLDGAKGHYSEEDEARPINYYGHTKLAGERFVADLCSRFVVARSALIYGTPLESTSSNSFSKRILEKAKVGEEIPLFTDQYRSPILVQDLAAALIELADNDFNGMIHLGGKDRVDRYTFGLRLAEVKGFNSSLLKPYSMLDVSLPAKRPQDVSFNTEKAESLLKTCLHGYIEGILSA